MNQPTKSNGVNYDCYVCKQTKKVPNLLGKFIIISNTEYKCNSCETIFERTICNICQKIQKIPITPTYYTSSSSINNINECSCK